jgi:hypothetical protein
MKPKNGIGGYRSVNESNLLNVDFSQQKYELSINFLKGYAHRRFPPQERARHGGR